MPVWISIAIAGYLSMALSQLLDKALLNVAFKEAKSFVFLIAALNVLAVVLIPFGVKMLDTWALLIALAAGALFIMALIPFLSALQGDNASRVIPLVGGLVPLFSFAGEWLFLDASFTLKQIFAFILLVLGSVVLTFSKQESKTKRSGLAAIKAILAALFFASSFLLTDYIFSVTGFINGFFWMRLGSVTVALFLLFDEDVRSGIKRFFYKHSMWIKSGYFATQGLNGLGFVLQNYAISLANVSLVNAMQGSQYMFIIIFVGVAAKVKPDLLGEEITLWLFIEKLTAVFFIVGGIALLAL